MLINTPMIAYPHSATVENRTGETFDESGAIVEEVKDRFSIRCFVDTPNSGRESNIIPNGKAENTYSFLVITPFHEKISETSVIVFNGRRLHIAWIANAASADSLLSLYCTEVIR